jgi:DNA-binding response OmpR family regulator
MTSHQILVVEDEQIVALDLEVFLKARGYSVTLAMTSQEALASAERLKPDLVLMDIQMGGPIDGIQAAERIRQNLDTPLIFVTAYTDHHIIERAAQVDPSGYIVKPFNERELAASIHLALSRRRNRGPVSVDEASPGKSEDSNTPIIQIGDLRIDDVRRHVFLGETEVRLTKKEFEILLYLAAHVGETVSPEAILSRVWGPQFSHYVQTLRVHIGNLRQKIENPSLGPMIKGVRGVGYRLVEADHQASVNRS